MTSFLLAFIPLFVAIDPIGNIPLFIGLTQGFSSVIKRRLALQAVATGLLVGLTFGTFGHKIFMLIGISADDFRIAGGVLLLILSIKEIFGSTVKMTNTNPEDKLIGVVPLGIPLIAGPAMMTTLLILHDIQPFNMILTALLANMVIALLLLFFAEEIVSLLGDQIARAAAKIIAIFLAAIGIMMIRKGLQSIFHLPCL
jgi:multiple antibiotic resistance protein